MPLLTWWAGLLLACLYIMLYASYGIDNDDTGYILGTAHQIFLGQSLYDHISCVKPPVSFILHSFVFHRPFSYAPVFVDRVFSIFEVAVYSLLSAALAQRQFRLTPGLAALFASLCFIFSEHAFPPMGWYTIDGIFFSVLSLWFLVTGLRPGNTWMLAISGCMAVLAAGTKQSFYPIPPALLLFALIEGKRWRAPFIMAVSMLLSALLLYRYIGMIGSTDMFWKSISAQTTLHDLLDAGISSYIRSLLDERFLYGSWPFLIVLPLAFILEKGELRVTAIALLICMGLFLANIAQFYLTEANSFQPLQLFSALFVATCLYSVLMAIRCKGGSWLVLVAMHAIAWCASISWGYISTILYSTPSMLTLGVILAPSFRQSAGFRLATASILPVALAVFWLGHQYAYSLEAPVRRSQITADMSGVSPSLRFIRGTPEQYRRYREMLQIIDGEGRRPYAVLPNMPLAHVLTGTPNPIGIDWALNVETGALRQAIRERLDSSVDFALVYRHPGLAPELPGKFGSEVTMHVRESWRLKKSTDDFLVFENPLRTGPERQERR